MRNKLRAVSAATLVVICAIANSAVAQYKAAASDEAFDPFTPPPVLTSNFLQDANSPSPMAVNSELAPLQQPAAGCLPGADCECCPHCRCHTCECPLQPAPCVPCPHVTTALPFYNLAVFGAVQGNMIFNTARPVAPGVPFFLAPAAAPGFAENTVDVHARSSSLGAALSGPEMGGFKAGGAVLFLFFNDNIILDRYGLLPLQAYGELKNEDWRFAAGLQFDVFNPNMPTMLVFSGLLGSGNTGNNFRGQFRAERYLHPTEDTQWTIQAALSEPIATAISDNLRLNEDNGWPNVEGRVAYSMGTPEQVGLELKRPFEVGLSGVGGQVRTAEVGVRQVVADVWGLGIDFSWKINDSFGVRGEWFTGQGLGTYNGGILQTTDAITFNAVRSRGGWGEVYYYLNPCLHTHWGYAIDDPTDVDTIGPTRNETFFANLIWDINSSLRLGFEFTRRETAYRLPGLDNQGYGFHTQVQWSF